MAIEILADLKVRVDALSLGVPCRLGSLDPNVNACVALILTGGPAPELGFGTDGVLHEMPHVQVVARGAPDSYDEPYNYLVSIYEDFAKIQATALTSGKLYHMVTPLQHPFPLDRRDEKGRSVWVVNFEVKREA